MNVHRWPQLSMPPLHEEEFLVLLDMTLLRGSLILLPAL